MDWLTVLLIVLVVGNIATVYLLWQRGQQKENGGSEQGFLLLQNRLEELTRTLDVRVAESSKQVHETVRAQLGESARLIKEVTQGLTKLDETNRQVVSFADQLQNLQDILKNPKQRGVLGEYYLETLLKNVLPPGSYEMQYPFPDGTIVDAAVFVKEKVIPVDSKFSLENYNRLAEEKDPVEKKRLEKVFENDLKNRITETAKYVQPAQGTMDFAFMFIPHEAIYYDLLVGRVGAVSEENLIQRAASKYKVIIVSPTSFLAYLQTVLQGLKALQIEEQASQIVAKVGDLGKHLKSYEEFYRKLGASLSTTVNHYNAAYRELGKVDKDVLKVTGASSGIDISAVDRPLLEGKEQ